MNADQLKLIRINTLIADTIERNTVKDYRKHDIIELAYMEGKLNLAEQIKEILDD